MKYFPTFEYDLTLAEPESFSSILMLFTFERFSKVIPLVVKINAEFFTSPFLIVMLFEIS